MDNSLVRSEITDHDLNHAIDRARELIIHIGSTRCIMMNQAGGGVKYVAIPEGIIPCLCDMCGIILRSPMDYERHYEGCKLKFIREIQKRDDPL
jgi:hypothetical protein